MISDRQLSILNAIVEDYVDLGQPIGSKTLIERHNLNVSPATIRNEMKQLEELQLIEDTYFIRTFAVRVRHQILCESIIATNISSTTQKYNV